METVLNSAVLMVLLVGSPPPESPAQAFASLPNNRRIRVTVRGHGQVIGRFRGLRGDTLVVATERDTVKIMLPTIDSLWISTSYWKAGAIVGAATIGVLTAVALGDLCRTIDSDQLCGLQGYNDVVVASISGALMGAFIGAIIPRWKPLYPRPRHSLKVP